MNSIIQDKKRCILCGREDGLEEHHIFQGSNRKLSEKYGIKAWLCHFCHKGVTTYDGTIEIWSGNRRETICTMDLLHILGQIAWEDNYGSREEFRAIFGRNYL